ncbi:MAG: hypothetical protein ABI873_05660 [Marmoricola sp.]
MKGGVILFRGTGAAACRYLESDRSRADDHYLEGGTALAAFTVTDGSGEVLATSELDAEAYAGWVDWIDPLTETSMGKPRLPGEEGPWQGPIEPAILRWATARTWVWPHL